MANTTDTPTQSFDPRAHLVSLGKRAGREQMYLEVKWRLVWFRAERPDWGIRTHPLHLDTEKGVAVWHAEVTDEGGAVLAAGSKMEERAHFGDYVEKAETGAIGRALAVLGYGSQHAGQDLEERLPVDSPVCAQATAPPAGNGHAANGNTCAGCGAGLTPGQATLSKERQGRPLCPACQGR